jgi:ATP-dependent DNA helicase 2 subunit 2
MESAWRDSWCGIDLADTRRELEQVTWFDPINSFNPVIHRIKEAIFHASLTQDLDADPLGPPHPELVKFFKTPEGLGERVQGVTQRLKEKLDIKKVPPRVRAAKKTKEGLRPDEG